MLKRANNTGIRRRSATTQRSHAVDETSATPAPPSRLGRLYHRRRCVVEGSGRYASELLSSSHLPPFPRHPPPAGLCQTLPQHPRPRQMRGGRTCERQPSRPTQMIYPSSCRSGRVMTGAGAPRASPNSSGSRAVRIQRFPSGRRWLAMRDRQRPVLCVLSVKAMEQSAYEQLLAVSLGSSTLPTAYVCRLLSARHHAGLDAGLTDIL